MKLFDFGLAKEIQDSDIVAGTNPVTYNMTGQTGSYRYMAPEVAKELPYNETADVYSFAILFSYVSKNRNMTKIYCHFNVENALVSLEEFKDV